MISCEIHYDYSESLNRVFYVIGKDEYKWMEFK